MPGVSLGMTCATFAQVIVKAGELHPADPVRNLESVSRLSKSDIVEVPGQPGKFIFAEDVPAGGCRTFRANEANGLGKTGQPIPVTDGKLTLSLSGYAPASSILQQ